MTDYLGYDDLRADTVRQVAKLVAASAITAHKSGGLLFLEGNTGARGSVRGAWPRFTRAA
jgi:hypothetical protein